MRDLGSIGITRNQQSRWKSGELALQWAKDFSHLFDNDDLRLALNQGKRGYHFYEWLGAIQLHHSTGFHALVGKYEFRNHSRKSEILANILDDKAITILRDRKQWGNAQAPDLLMYAPDFSDYFFCEIKGPGDRLSKSQAEKFGNLETLIEREIYILKFCWMQTGFLDE